MSEGWDPMMVLFYIIDEKNPNHTTRFLIQNTTPLHYCTHQYCVLNGLDKDSVRFLLQGMVRISDHYTPNMLAMRNNDIVYILHIKPGDTNEDDVFGDRHLHDHKLDS